MSIWSAVVGDKEEVVGGGGPEEEGAAPGKRSATYVVGLLLS